MEIEEITKIEVNELYFEALDALKRCLRSENEEVALKAVLCILNVQPLFFKPEVFFEKIYNFFWFCSVNATIVNIGV